MRKSIYIPLKDTKIHISVTGKGYPIFMLYGGPGLDINYFGNFFDGLQDEFMLIYVDYRSHGKSEDADAKTLTLEQFAMDVKDLSKELNLNEYALLGHSLGGYVCLQYAITYNEKRTPLILLNTLYNRVNPEPFRESCIANLRQADQEKVRLADEFIQRSKGLQMDELKKLQKEYEGKASHRPKNFPFASIEQTKYLRNVNFKPQIDEVMYPNYSKFDISDKLHLIKHPICIITSTHDYECDPSQSLTMHEKINDTELHIIENTGHTPFIVASKEINKIIREFLKRKITIKNFSQRSLNNYEQIF